MFLIKVFRIDGTVFSAGYVKISSGCWVLDDKGAQKRNNRFKR